MKSSLIAALVSLGLASAAIAQTTAPTPSAPSPSAPSTTAGMPEQRFTDTDKDRNGLLEGAELETHRAVLSQVDKNGDGKISRTEYLDGAKAGHIK